MTPADFIKRRLAEIKRRRNERLLPTPAAAARSESDIVALVAALEEALENGSWHLAIARALGWTEKKEPE